MNREGTSHLIEGICAVLQSANQHLYERGAAHALNHSSLSCRLAYSFVASSWFGNNYLQLKSASIRHQRKETTCEEAFSNIIS